MRLSYFAVCMFAMSALPGSGPGQTAAALSLTHQDALQFSQVFENEDKDKLQREQVAQRWKEVAEKTNKAAADNEEQKKAGDEAKVKALTDQAAAKKKKYQEDMKAAQDEADAGAGAAEKEMEAATKMEETQEAPVA